MSNKNVTKIERLSSGMVKLYNRSNVIGAFSALNSISIGYENNNARTIQFTDNGNTISFQVFNLQEIIGSTTTVTYTPIDTTSTGPDYNARVFEVFDFLSSQVFQGFSPGPTFVGGVVAAYPNFASFPVTGTQSVIYIDEADNSAYYWDGSAYQLLVSTGVEQYASFALFPVTGSANVIYIDMSTFGAYVWDGLAYESLAGGSGIVSWGSITGTLSDQTDLQTALDAKFDDPTGTTAEYIRGDGTLATFPALTGYVPYTGATTNVDLGEYELKAGQLSLDISPTGTAAVGTTRWNNTIGSSETTLKGGSVILKNGVDLVARVVNKVTPNTTLTKAAYQAVRVSGAAGQRLAVEFAQANNDANSADTIGLVTETIATNQEGFIMTVGNLEEINTTGSLQGETWADGDVLYLSPTTEGALTNIKPNGSTGHIVVMGYVEYAHAIHGKIYVKIMNGWELDELHNVYINAPTTWQVLRYDATAGYWTNSSLSASILPGGIDASKIGAGTVNNTEFGYLDGVTSSIQTQIGSKQDTLTLTTTGTSGAATLVGSTLNIPQYSGGGGGASVIDIQTFTSSGVWTKPAGAKQVEVYIFGAGGGGGSGRRGAASSARYGGGGGATGSVFINKLDASVFSSTENIWIGAGGTGGNARITNDTNGGQGNAGGDTYFGGTGGSGDAKIIVTGGAAGAGGTNTANGAGQAPYNLIYGTLGTSNTYSSQSNNSNGFTTNLTSNMRPLTSGVYGGGIDTANNINNGSSITNRKMNFTNFYTTNGGVAPGGAGVNGLSTFTDCNFVVMSSGGSGGASGDTAGTIAGGTGGNGGICCGGGGGGASTNGANSGAGGTGGNGLCIVITYF